MKARVKATGEIVEVVVKTVTPIGSYEPELRWVDKKSGISYSEDELFLSEYICNNPDYWTRLEHQYAGMAMQGYIIAAHLSHFSFCENDMKDCVSMATALVEKLKEKEERK